MLDDDNLRKDHIHTIEKKITKNLGLLYCAKLLLNEESFKIIYLPYIRFYLNNANVAQAGTYCTNLKTIQFEKIIFEYH